MSPLARSRERASIGGPSYMSNDQVASYLHGLRQNRPQRPAGARPSPFAPRIPKDVIISSLEGSSTDSSTAPSPQDNLPRRTDSSLSHTRSQSATPTFLGRPLVRAPSRSPSPAPTTLTNGTTAAQSPPQVQYLPDGRRWMEKQEAVSLRRALEDMDSADDQRIHKAAQDEASELVWKHQNPNSNTPYRYRDHLRKGSYTRNHGQGARSISGGSQTGESMVRDFASGKRSASGGSGGEVPQVASRESSDSNVAKTESQVAVSAEAPAQPQPLKETTDHDREDPVKIKFASSIFNHARRRSSGESMRKISGQSGKGTFSNPNDRIYEEPEETTPKKTVTITTSVKPSAIPERRNPFARLRSTRSNMSIPARSSTMPQPDTKTMDRIEIQKNPPSQSHDPSYVENEPLFSFNATAKLPPPGQSDEDLVKTKDGMEIRSDDIRAATSKRLSDRSVKLPTPVLVSDSPGRPIVSFKEQKQVVLKEEMSNLSAEKPTALAVKPPNLSEERPPQTDHQVALENSTKPTKTQHNLTTEVVGREHQRPSVKLQGIRSMSSIDLPVSPTVSRESVQAPSIPSISVDAAPPRIPIISLNDDPPPSIPVIAINDSPSIAVSPPRPLPAISVSAPAIPTISASEGAPPTPPPNRPLPTPTKRGGLPPSRPQPGPLPPRQSTKHMSLVGPPRMSALCTACALPIAGRIVSAAGSRFHPECFRCHHCSEALECVAFYPEPDNAHARRVDRIQRRMNNEYVKAGEGSTEQEDCELEEKDGWSEDTRFYCHLDFHEFFSPRCKSCKTPIEGEVIVACGAEWHAGHFFCAQCGDPFDAATPFVEKDGYAWCVNCHTNRYSTKCKKCRKPVIDTVVNALGAEWHEQCFCCTECGGKFDDGRYFLRPGGTGQDPVCVRCEDRRLKA